MSEATVQQSSPQPTDSPDVWELVKVDMEARRQFGLKKYGQPVRCDNGRDQLVDAYQEVLDQAVYLRSEIERRKRTHLFQLGNFTLRSGSVSAWKIECDALTSADWDALARMAHEILSPFCTAVGVPRGGIPFAKAMERYGTGNGFHPVLVCEDVVTTGGSMERFVNELKNDPIYHDCKFSGVCVFARDKFWPNWVTPLFAYDPRSVVDRAKELAVRHHEMWKDFEEGMGD